MAMRTPTPRDVLYAWHAKALRGENPPIHDGEPHCGFFLVRLIWPGPLLPASIYMEQPIDQETGELAGDETMHAECMGEPWDVLDAWTRFPKRPTCRLFYLQRLAELM